MYLRAEKQTVTEYIKILRRIFSFNNSWTNKDLEIVQLGSGSVPGVYQRFGNQDEKYPVITVTGGGGKYNNTGLNNLVHVYDNDQYYLGNRMQSMKLLNSDNAISMKLPRDVEGLTVRGVFAQIGNIESDYSEDPLDVFLIQDLESTPTILSSGSFRDIGHSNLIREYTELFPTLLLSAGNEYWIQFKVPNNSLASYIIGIDISSELTYVYGNDSEVSGGITGSILLPAFVRVGGMFQGSLAITVESKNDVNMARDLSELVAMYTNLLKHSQVLRSSPDTINTRSLFIETGLIDEWIEKGIRIGDISVGESQMRRRGDNEEIYSITTRVDYYTDWFQDYPAEALKNINIILQKFDELEDFTSIDI